MLLCWVTATGESTLHRKGQKNAWQNTQSLVGSHHLCLSAKKRKPVGQNTECLHSLSLPHVPYNYISVESIEIKMLRITHFWRFPTFTCKRSPLLTVFCWWRHLRLGVAPRIRNPSGNHAWWFVVAHSGWKSESKQISSGTGSTGVSHSVWRAQIAWIWLRGHEIGHFTWLQRNSRQAPSQRHQISQQANCFARVLRTQN